MQTYSPEHEVLRYAADYDYKAFFEREIALRKAACFPPFGYIARVMVVSEDRDKAVEALKNVWAGLETLYNENKEQFLFFNKMNSPIKRLQGRHRLQALMRYKDGALTEKIYALSLKHMTKDVLVYVEENPNNLS